jgi:cytidylate kinase
MLKHLVVAIDGPAGAGKSTIARRVAAKMGFVYIDTGAMYRAVALWALRQNVDLSEAGRLEELAQAARIEFAPGASGVLLNGADVTEAIRSPEISQAASRVSSIPGVRKALVEKQREMGARQSVVMEGRDIGSVVFPDAGVKVFLDADPAERTLRRARELEQQGETVRAEEVAEQILERDQRDRTRAAAPLVQAPGAVYLDTTRLTLDQVEAVILNLIRKSLR